MSSSYSLSSSFLSPLFISQSAASYGFGTGGGSGAGFPYTGSAVITGSLIVTGSVNAYSFTGSLLGNSTNGIPAGGFTGQYLFKNSNTDYDVIWATSQSNQVNVPIQTVSYVVDGTTSSFTVSSSNHDVNQLIVNINGIIQTPLRHYYINSSSFYDLVVLDQTPVSNSIVEIRTLQASYASILVITSSLTSSVTSSISSSYAVTASYALNGGGSGESFHPFLLG
jgi:hypothetical protein